MSVLAAVLALLAAPPLAYPSSAPGQVQGVVRSSEGGVPVAYANVQVLGQSISDWTDAAGGYSLDDLPEGRWRIRVVHPNHDSLTLEIFVPGGRGLALDLTLDARPGPTVDALRDFAPFRVEYVLPALLNGDEVTKLIAEQYPKQLIPSRVSGETVLLIWLDELGQPVRSEVTRSSGYPSLDSVAEQISERMRFRPAKNRGAPVRVRVQIPVVFTEPEVPPAESRR